MVPVSLVVGLLSAIMLACAAVLAAACLRRRRVAEGTGEDGDVEKGVPTAKVADGKDLPDEGKKCYGGPAGVRRYSWKEIEELTTGFSSAVVGQGGFSTVYLAKLPDSSSSSLGAVKVHSDSERLHRAFMQELDVLLRVHHRSIVNLIGYCDENEEGALVFEYVPNGTLHDKLHGSGGDAAVAEFPWGRRMSIALEVAEALDHLHERCDLQIVHGDIKPSNILLDNELRSKLCDFGSAKMGFSSTVAPPRHNPMVGSPGYADPHYLRTGIASKKSDVYSFGVLLLELVTGREAFCSETGRMLAAEVAEDGAVVRDERLLDAGDCSTEVAALAMRCVGGQPSLRPSMGEIVRILTEEVSSSISAVDDNSKGRS